MNQISGYIIKINQFQGIYEVFVQTKISMLKVILFENPVLKNHLQKDQKVILYFKEFSILISKKFLGNIINIQNYFSARIVRMKRGRIFSELQIKSQNEYLNVLTENSTIENMLLGEGENIFVYIKPTDIILEVQ